MGVETQEEYLNTTIANYHADEDLPFVGENIFQQLPKKVDGRVNFVLDTLKQVR
ncbi:MAG: hypothetical protein HC903_04495 [Methylacidiphilales bacterium]|nr:hypothetical protein [Candidatus Methylacidiphilales bacterium]